jgi:hypothetical protein
MMMPTILRDLSAGDTATLNCARAGGRLVVTKIVERPSGAIIARGPVVSVTNSSITIRGVTCTFSTITPANPRMMMPTVLRGGQALVACLRANGQIALTAATQLTPTNGRILVAGNVDAVGARSITVNGVTCVLAGTKPLPGMPTTLRGIDPGDSAVMACSRMSGRLVAVAVASR